MTCQIYWKGLLLAKRWSAFLCSSVPPLSCVCKIIWVLINYINHFIDNWLYQLFYYLVWWGCGLVTISLSVSVLRRKSSYGVTLARVAGCATDCFVHRQDGVFSNRCWDQISIKVNKSCHRLRKKWVKVNKSLWHVF